ncbi:CBO0543 family protein [Anaerobacillus sp. MEB173]|uniref:CBO0543 family protein n=1 Tax=Anaerobacillus sp. MEB173 TaxID=3383345 RepID=UPI003F9068EB
MKHFILILSIILYNLFRKSWRAIPKYYKSLVFVSIVNTFYYIVCKRHLVWEFMPVGINWKVIRVAHVIIVTPLLVLSFLSKFPQTLTKQVLYLMKAVFVASSIELLIHKNKLIQYKHGWNIYWTSLLYMKMFVYSYLFTKRPMITCVLTLCSTIFFIVKFKVPVTKKHVFSSRFDKWVDYFYHSFLEDVF